MAPPVSRYPHHLAVTKQLTDQLLVFLMLALYFIPLSGGEAGCPMDLDDGDPCFFSRTCLPPPPAASCCCPTHPCLASGSERLLVVLLLQFRWSTCCGRRHTTRSASLPRSTGSPSCTSAGAVWRPRKQMGMPNSSSLSRPGTPVGARDGPTGSIWTLVSNNSPGRVKGPPMTLAC